MVVKTFRGPVLVVVLVLAALANEQLLAQAPTTLKGNPLAGVIDFHVHSGPDSFTRSISDVEIARIARANKMGALVLKNHAALSLLF